MCRITHCVKLYSVCKITHFRICVNYTFFCKTTHFVQYQSSFFHLSIGKFYTWPIFFTQPAVVMVVTNMKYVLLLSYPWHRCLLVHSNGHGTLMTAWSLVSHTHSTRYSVLGTWYSVISIRYSWHTLMIGLGTLRDCCETSLSLGPRTLYTRPSCCVAGDVVEGCYNRSRTLNLNSK